MFAVSLGGHEGGANSRLFKQQGDPIGGGVDDRADTRGGSCPGLQTGQGEQV